MDLKLPDLGEGVVEGEIVKWRVKPGEAVKEDQVVVEIMTDKATVEVPTKFGGTVSEVLLKEGDIAKVGQVIMRFAGGAGAAKTAPATQASTAAASRPSAPTNAPASRPTTPVAALQTGSAGTGAAAGSVRATAVATGPTNSDFQAAPAVRKAAREMGVDLTRVRGSGPHGRILLEDLKGGGASAGPSINFARSSGVRGSREEERVPVRGVRKKIIEKMAQSKRTAAHFTYVEECDITELNAFRKQLKERLASKGVKVTFMPFIAKAAAICLKEFPELNASLLEDNGVPTEIVYKKYYNLGMAVDTEDGLTVPVIKDVDCKGIIELSAEMQQLAEKARDRKLAPADFHDGTFTITNAGTIGGIMATPIINYPEVAILGVHQLKRRPLVIDEEIKIRDVMWFSISLDHRVVDGAVAARFMNRFVGLIQNPEMLLLEMLGADF